MIIHSTRHGGPRMRVKHSPKTNDWKNLVYHNFLKKFKNFDRSNIQQTVSNETRAKREVFCWNTNQGLHKRPKSKLKNNLKLVKRIPYIYIHLTWRMATISTTHLNWRIIMKIRRDSFRFRVNMGWLYLNQYIQIQHKKTPHLESFNYLINWLFLFIYFYFENSLNF